ncbi:MAG: ferredoxin [Candidatus Omnitrophota bacterium]|jgi:ferredoxin
MAHVITEKCLGERYAACAAVCPVSSIHPGEYQGKIFMVIDPESCIDCGVCLPECPVDSIVSATSENEEFAKINADLAPEFSKNPEAEMRDVKEAPNNPENKLVR